MAAEGGREGGGARRAHRSTPGWHRLLLAGVACAAAAPAQSEHPSPTLEELVEVADLSGLAASPDGRYVAFRTDRPSIARNSYRLDWHVVDLASGAVRRIASGGEPIMAEPGALVAEAPIWSPDGRWLYYRALSGGAVQLWRAALDGSGAAPVTSEAGDVESLERAQDGGGIVFRVGPPRAEIEAAELAEYDSGILVDEHVELAQNVFRGAIINGRHASQRLTGQWFARGGLLWSRPFAERKLDFGTLAVSPARPQDLPAAAGAPAAEAVARSDRGDVATAAWDGAEGQLRVERSNRAGRPISCGHRLCREARIVWLAWRPGRDQILFATADRAHVQTVHLWDVRTGRVRPVAASDGLLNGGRNASAPCAIAGGSALCVSAGPTSPPRLERIDLASGARRMVFDPNAALRARRWPIAERLEWRSAEGRIFTGTLFRTADAKGPLPLFINYYRCEGFLRGGVGDEWPLAILAGSGIASVCVNATRMTGPQDGVGQYRAAQGGIEALIDLLGRRGAIDRARIGMGGLSFGSEVTMWMVMHTGLIAVASVASPQVEPADYWINGVRGRDHHQLLRQVWGLGSPDETPDRWRLISPAYNIEHIRAPLLLQLSEQESRYAMELYSRLTNTATPTELHVFPDESHIKTQPRHRLAVYRRNLDWFRFWLQGLADDDPRRSDQYRRWSALAERWRSVSPARSAATAPGTPDRRP